MTTRKIQVLERIIVIWPDDSLVTEKIYTPFLWAVRIVIVMSLPKQFVDFCGYALKIIEIKCLWWFQILVCENCVFGKIGRLMA